MKPAPTQTQVTRVLASYADLQMANSSLLYIFGGLEFDGEPIHYTELRRFEAFEASAIISYARPFVQSRKGAPLKLKLAGIKFTPKEKIIHKRIMDLRSQVIAHSDEDQMSFRVDIHEVMFEHLPHVHFQRGHGLYLEEKPLREFQDLVCRLTAVVYSSIIDIAAVHPTLVEQYKRPKIYDTAPS